jgi:hypothetical protein
MKTNQDWRIEESGRTARSVLECGSPLPLSMRHALDRQLDARPWQSVTPPCQSARGLAQSKTWRSVIALCLLTGSLAAVTAQNYSIDWHTIDGGGGTSTGGVYSVSGTIGQPDAGTMSGGSYSVAGGFWGIISAIQTPGAPLLTIRRTQTNTVVVSWPSPSPGFVLQQNGNLNTSNWIAASESVTDNGANKFIVVNPPSGNRFYRLFKP